MQQIAPHDKLNLGNKLLKYVSNDKINLIKEVNHDKILTNGNISYMGLKIIYNVLVISLMFNKMQILFTD